MRVIELPSWSDFPKAIADIRAEFGSHTTSFGKGREITSKNDILFRGQSNSKWDLTTTLERTIDKKYSIRQYLHRANVVVDEIQSVTGVDWKVPPFPTICEELGTDSLDPRLPCYEYLVYLRHHGFPSPLLDWTQSPYIAAYFAFEQSNEAEQCSVFAFIERPEGGKSMCESDVVITQKGPYITTHARHFTQKAVYTIATKWDRELQEHFFSSHQAATARSDEYQDVLIKLTIPRSNRISVLKELEDYNINRYTLFRTEDALVQSLGLRAFDMNM